MLNDFCIVSIYDATFFQSSSFPCKDIKADAATKVPLFFTGGKDSAEGHSIKAMLSLSMVTVLQRRVSPDEARFGVAASTTSTLLIVVGTHNIAL